MKEKLMQAYAWFQKNSTVVKIVFITFVMAFVILKLLILRRELTIHR